MNQSSEQTRLAQSGVHDNPDFVLKYLEEIELLAENVIAERREIIELNKRRDKLREASRYDYFFFETICKRDTSHFCLS